MAERANDEILQLAGQGNLQALSVYLNRHLIPSGAHVKVKQREDALHVLVVVMSETENGVLIDSVQRLLIKLNPAQVKRVKVYTQVLGQKQASLRQQFSLPSAVTGAPSIPTSPPPARSNTPQTFTSVPSRPTAVPLPVSQGTPATSAKPTQFNPPAQNKARRYSVADFLAQSSNLEELRVLQDHPFFTGICPNCRHAYSKATLPPTYWDCPKCGWKDDLSQSMPRNPIQQDSHQTSIAESKRLGDYLVEAGLLTVSQIEVALADQVTTQLRFGEVLIRRGWVKEETIEYLMQKVILPERTAQQNAVSYLESSRNLLKTLLKVRSGPQVPNSHLINPSIDILNQTVPSHPPMQEGDGSTPPKPKPPASSPVKLANERETLILPDVDLDELDAYLNGSQDKNGRSV